MLVHSASADASTEDAVAHATGNGVASEVGRTVYKLEICSKVLSHSHDFFLVHVVTYL